MFQACHMVSEEGYGMADGYDGPGERTDFILYVSAKITGYCDGRNVGYAAHCQQEARMDR